jgi:hypothetical protein
MKYNYDIKDNMIIETTFNRGNIYFWRFSELKKTRAYDVFKWKEEPYEDIKSWNRTKKWTKENYPELLL